MYEKLGLECTITILAAFYDPVSATHGASARALKHNQANGAPEDFLLELHPTSWVPSSNKSPFIRDGISNSSSYCLIAISANIISNMRRSQGCNG